jgi:HD-GYP domain-containing protein (c-di-GMP phosphodiesterase class II)
MHMKLEKQLLKSLLLMGSLIEARDAYTGGHVWRVSQYAEKLAEAAGMPEQMVYLAGVSGFLHDLGKIGIPDHILHKRGRLSRAEYETVKTHPGIGVVCIREHPLARLVLQAVHQHHEWMNGEGYPEGLHEEEISTFGRIVGIADVFDALTSTRPYHREMAMSSAVEIMLGQRGTHFEASLADAFIQLTQQGALKDIAGHSDWGVPLVDCPNCGPVITVTRDTPDGEIGACRVCGTRHRLHRREDSFVAEGLGIKGTAAELQPQPEGAAIDYFIDRAPSTIEI